MPSYSATSPVSAGVYAALNVPALIALAPGGVHDDIEQGTGFPFVLYEVPERAAGGLGTRQGSGHLSEVDLRVHVLSKYEGMKEAQAVMDKVLELLRFAPTVSGYSSWEIFYHETALRGDDVVNGVKVKGISAFFTLHVEAL